MATSGTMKVSVVGDASKFNRMMDSTQKRLKGLGGSASKFGKMAAAGVAGAGAAAVAAAGKLARFGDEVAESASQAGLGTEQYQEMKFAFEELGVAAPQQAMQKFNRRIGEAADGAGPAVSSIDALNLSLENADGSLRDTGEVMDDAIGKLAGVEDESRRAAIAGDLFGKKAGPELVAQLGEGGASVEDLRQKAQDMGLVMDGDALEASQKFSGAMDDIKNRALGLLRQGLTPVLMFITDNVIPFITGKVIPTLSKFSDWIGPKLSAAAQTAQDLFDNQVMPALEKLSAWWEKNGPAVIATAEDIWSAIQKMADIVSGAIDTVIGWFDKSEGKASKTGKNVASTFKVLKKTLSVVFDAIADIVATVIGWIQRAWEKWGSDILAFAKSTFNNILDFIDGILTAIGGVFDVFAGVFTGDWERVWDGIKAIFSGIWDAIKAILSQQLDALKLLWAVFKDIFAKVWNDFWTGVKQTLKGILDGIVGFFSSLPGWVVGALSGAWGAWETFWNSVWTAVKDFVSDRVDDVVGFVTDLPGRAREALAGAWETLKTFWSDVFDDLKEGASDRIDDMVEFFEELPDRIVDGLGDLGSLLIDAGKQLLEGLGEGVKSAVGSLGSALSDAVTSAADKLPFVDASGDGPGFGVPGVAGGQAMDRAQAAMEGLPVRVTSTYRTPEENARVGGSPTSFHLDKSNPAVDIGGPMWALDVVAARLREMNANRELLWRTAGHFDHVHVAHSGGTVTRQGIEPLKADEVVAKLRAGETVRTRQQESELQRGGGNEVHVHLESRGNVRADAQAAKLALMRG